MGHRLGCRFGTEASPFPDERKPGFYKDLDRGLGERVDRGTQGCYLLSVLFLPLVVLSAPVSWVKTIQLVT